MRLGDLLGSGMKRGIFAVEAFIFSLAQILPATVKKGGKRKKRGGLLKSW